MEAVSSVAGGGGGGVESMVKTLLTTGVGVSVEIQLMLNGVFLMTIMPSDVATVQEIIVPLHQHYRGRGAGIWMALMSKNLPYLEA